VTYDRDILAVGLLFLGGLGEISSLCVVFVVLGKLFAVWAELVDDRSGCLGSRRPRHCTQSCFANVPCWCSPTQPSTIHDDRPFLIAEANLSGLANSCVG
jgi:hypothetical protein